jgi:glycine/D-amino acid oxidase-like deaminating enzyme
MAGTPFDVIIVGQGIAGTTLAWHLQDEGRRVLIVDAGEPVTSSKIAAGLITPITGRRLVLDPRFDTFMTAARAFYTSIEKRTGQSFFHHRTALRLFRSEAERRTWAERKDRPDYRGHLVVPQPEPLIDPELSAADADGFAMQAAQLDAPAYLEASRAALACEAIQLDWTRDVVFGPEFVSVGGMQTRLLVSCEGYGAARNPRFPSLPFNAARGDILTVRFHRPVPAMTLHRGIWLAPTGEPHIFNAGATYDWTRLDHEPDPSARAELEDRLEALIRVPYTVLDHRAAVRPILADNSLLIGRHPDEPRLGLFNGLGSKGSLLAPFHARLLAAHLVHGTSLPADLDAARHLRP